MGLRNVRTEGDEILKKKSKEVEVIDDKIKELIKDMIDTMHEFDGVGLAAVQVGILKKIIVIDLYDEKPIIKLINPVITKTKGTQEVEEGCLSFPNMYVKTKRPAEVTVEALDENGKNIKITGTRTFSTSNFTWDGPFKWGGLNRYHDTRNNTICGTRKYTREKKE